MTQLRKDYEYRKALKRCKELQTELDELKRKGLHEQTVDYLIESAEAFAKAARMLCEMRSDKEPPHE